MAEETGDGSGAMEGDILIFDAEQFGDVFNEERRTDSDDESSSYGELQTPAKGVRAKQRASFIAPRARTPHRGKHESTLSAVSGLAFEHLASLPLSRGPPTRGSPGQAASATTYTTTTRYRSAKGGVAQSMNDAGFNRVLADSGSPSRPGFPMDVKSAQPPTTTRPGAASTTALPSSSMAVPPSSSTMAYSMGSMDYTPMELHVDSERRLITQDGRAMEDHPLAVAFRMGKSPSATGKGAGRKSGFKSWKKRRSKKRKTSTSAVSGGRRDSGSGLKVGGHDRHASTGMVSGIRSLDSRDLVTRKARGKGAALSHASLDLAATPDLRGGTKSEMAPPPGSMVSPGPSESMFAHVSRSRPNSVIQTPQRRMSATVPRQLARPLQTVRRSSHIDSAAIHEIRRGSLVRPFTMHGPSRVSSAAVQPQLIELSEQSREGSGRIPLVPAAIGSGSHGKSSSNLHRESTPPPLMPDRNAVQTVHMTTGLTSNRAIPTIDPLVQSSQTIHHLSLDNPVNSDGLTTATPMELIADDTATMVDLNSSRDRGDSKTQNKNGKKSNKESKKKRKSNNKDGINNNNNNNDKVKKRRKKRHRKLNRIDEEFETFISTGFDTWKKRYIRQSFKSEKIEQAFQSYYRKQNATIIQIFVVLILLTNFLLYPLYDISSMPNASSRLGALVTRAIANFVIVIFVIQLWRGNYVTIEQRAMLLFNLFVVCYSITVSVLGKDPGTGVYIVLMFCSHLLSGLGHIRSSIICWTIVVAFSLLKLYTLTASFNQLSSLSWEELSSSIFFLVGSAMFLSMMGIFLELSARRQFIKKQRLDWQEAKSSKALSTLLPPKIARALREGKRVAFRTKYVFNSERQCYQSGVCVLFCQICDFHDLVSTLDAKKLVEVLNEIFTLWDKKAKVYKVFKVETINEIYMAATGLPHPQVDPNQDYPHPSRLARFANELMYHSDEVLKIEYSVDDMINKPGQSHPNGSGGVGSGVGGAGAQQSTPSASSTQHHLRMGSAFEGVSPETVKRKNLERGRTNIQNAALIDAQPEMKSKFYSASYNRYNTTKTQTLKIRIGMNIGDVVSGVIGEKLPRYRLFGDTVNTASRHESTCEPGKIQMSIRMYENVSKEIQQRCDKRENVWMKGKGHMTTYIMNQLDAVRQDDYGMDVCDIGIVDGTSNLMNERGSGNRAMMNAMAVPSPARSISKKRPQRKSNEEERNNQGDLVFTDSISNAVRDAGGMTDVSSVRTIGTPSIIAAGGGSSGSSSGSGASGASSVTAIPISIVGSTGRMTSVSGASVHSSAAPVVHSAVSISMLPHGAGGGGSTGSSISLKTRNSFELRKSPSARSSLRKQRPSEDGSVDSAFERANSGRDELKISVTGTRSPNRGPMKMTATPVSMIINGSSGVSIKKKKKGGLATPAKMTKTRSLPAEMRSKMGSGPGSSDFPELSQRTPMSSVDIGVEDFVEGPKYARKMSAGGLSAASSASGKLSNRNRSSSGASSVGGVSSIGAASTTTAATGTSAATTATTATTTTRRRSSVKSNGSGGLPKKSSGFRPRIRVDGSRRSSMRGSHQRTAPTPPPTRPLPPTIHPSSPRKKKASISQKMRTISTPSRKPGQITPSLGPISAKIMTSFPDESAVSKKAFGSIKEESVSHAHGFMGLIDEYEADSDDDSSSSESSIEESALSAIGTAKPLVSKDRPVSKTLPLSATAASSAELSLETGLSPKKSLSPSQKKANVIRKPGRIKQLTSHFESLGKIDTRKTDPSPHRRRMKKARSKPLVAL